MRRKVFSPFRTTSFSAALRRIFYVVLASALTTQLCAQPHRDGEIISSKPLAPLPAFESLDDFGRAYFPRAQYEEARTQKEFEFLDIEYASGGFDVPGLLIRPKNPGNRKWPAIIYNRGGTGDFGRIVDDAPCSRAHSACLVVVDLFVLAKAGFVVIASDYRFHGPTAKRDEWGGADVDDVLNIVSTVQSLAFVDRERLFMMGVSRGGTMTYLALKRGVPVRAAAVVAAPSDLEAWGRSRPDLINGDETYDGWAKVWPDYSHRAAEPLLRAIRGAMGGQTHRAYPYSAQPPGPTCAGRPGPVDGQQSAGRKSQIRAAHL